MPEALVIGGCKLEEKLGQGGMGAVYKATHQTLGRVVAIKLLPAEFAQNPVYVQRFLREARAIAKLQHSNIVQIYDAGEQAGQYFICMEYVEGSSLGARIKNGPPITEREGLRFLEQALLGLAVAHAAGMVHRDIKPENLLLGPEGSLKIADFGLVAMTQEDSGLTRSGTMVGTPLYMSPEQCEGEPTDARSDLYSLGASFYHIFTGNPPFSATTAVGILVKHKLEAPKNPRLSNTGLSAGTSDLILRLMAKHPNERYQSSNEILPLVGMIRHSLSSMGEPALRMNAEALTIRTPRVTRETGPIPTSQVSQPVPSVAVAAPVTAPVPQISKPPEQVFVPAPLPPPVPAEVTRIEEPVAFTPPPMPPAPETPPPIVPEPAPVAFTPPPAPPPLPVKPPTPPSLPVVVQAPPAPAQPPPPAPVPAPPPYKPPVLLDPTEAMPAVASASAAASSAPPSSQPFVLLPGSLGVPSGRAPVAPVAPAPSQHQVFVPAPMPPPIVAAPAFTPAPAPAPALNPVPGQVPGAITVTAPVMPAVQNTTVTNPVVEAKPKSRAWIGVLVAALLIVGVIMLIRSQRQNSLEENRVRIAELRKQHQYENALRAVEAAMEDFPEQEEFKGLQKAVENEFYQQRVENYRLQALATMERKQFAESVSSSDLGLTAIKAWKALAAATPGAPDKAELEFKDLRLQILDRQAYAHEMEDGKTAERLGNFTDSVTHFAKARDVERITEPMRATAATAWSRARVQELLAQARTFSDNGQFRQAMDALSQSATLNLPEFSSEQQQLVKRVKFSQLVSDGEQLFKAGKLREAADQWEEAASLAPDALAREELLVRARGATSKAGGSEAIARGDEALKAKRWKDAKAAFAEAVKTDPRDLVSTKKYRMAEAGEAADRAKIAVANLQWQTFANESNAAVKGDPDNEEYKRMQANAQKQLKAIETQRESGRKFEALGQWSSASDVWTQLLKTDPGEKVYYNQHIDVCASTVSAIQNVKDGKISVALRAINKALDADTNNVLVATMKTSLQVIEAGEQVVMKMKDHRADAQASIQVALDEDPTDRKTKAWLDETKAWETKLDAQVLLIRSLWLDKSYDKVKPNQENIRQFAKDMGDYFTELSAQFRAKVAGGVRPHRPAQIGDKPGLTKSGQVFASTAVTLKRSGMALSRIGEGQ